LAKFASPPWFGVALNVNMKNISHIPYHVIQHKNRRELRGENPFGNTAILRITVISI